MPPVACFATEYSPAPPPRFRPSAQWVGSRSRTLLLGAEVPQSSVMPDTHTHRHTHILTRWPPSTTSRTRPVAPAALPRSRPDERRRGNIFLRFVFSNQPHAGVDSSPPGASDPTSRTQGPAEGSPTGLPAANLGALEMSTPRPHPSQSRLGIPPFWNQQPLQGQHRRRPAAPSCTLSSHLANGRMANCAVETQLLAAGWGSGVCPR
jgi:hypothetical protein